MSATTQSVENGMAGELEGELHKVNRGGLLGVSSKKVFTVCNGSSLATYRSEHERAKGEAPLKHVPIRSDTRVEDTGLQRVSERKQLYTFALHYATSDSQHKTLILGSKHPEITAAWRSELGRIRARLLAAAGTPAQPTLHSFGSSAGDDEPSVHVHSDREHFRAHKKGATSGKLPSDLVPFSETVESVREHNRKLRETVIRSEEPMHDAETSGDERPSVMLGGKEAPDSSSWRIVHLANGIRVFEERRREGHSTVPAMKAISRVNAPADVIFRLVMDLNLSRAEWDTTFERGRVVESIDGHTDIVNFRTGSTSVFPLKLAPRDFCFIRNWRREEDGTYVVLFRSTTHPCCPAPEGAVRGNLLGGGYIITPLHTSSNTENGRPDRGTSLVTHLIELAPDNFLMKHVAPCLGAERTLHMKLLLRLAGIRDFFDQVSDLSVRHIIALPTPDGEEDEDDKSGSRPSSTKHNYNDSEEQFPAEERFATPDGSDDAHARASIDESGPLSNGSAEAPQENQWPEASVEHHNHYDGENLREPTLQLLDDTVRSMAERGSLRQGHWPERRGEPSEHAWCEVDNANQFMVRSKSYLQDNVKRPAGGTMGRLVATDWFYDDERIDNVCARPGSVAQQKLIPHARQNNEFLFCMNIQVPGSCPYSIVFYFLLPREYAEDSRYLFARSLREDDSFKDAHFKLIPSVTKGAWVVKRSVGTKPLIVGGALKVRYDQGEEFLECDVDVGSSSVASSVVRFVMSTLKTLVIDLAVLMESKIESDLPEKLIGTLRVMHVDPDAAVRPPPPAER